MTDWRDQLAGHRMQVDRSFSDRIRESELSSQEWSLVMTAVEFDVNGEGSDARLVADTSRIDTVVSEFDSVEQPGMGGGAVSKSTSGGLWDSIADTLGLGSDDESAKRDVAVDLANEYARTLQEHLESQNRWEAIRRAANQSSEK